MDLPPDDDLTVEAFARHARRSMPGLYLILQKDARLPPEMRRIRGAWKDSATRIWHIPREATIQGPAPRPMERDSIMTVSARPIGPMRTAIYARTTYDELEAIAEDIELSRRWIERTGHDFVASYADNGCPADDLERPGLTKLLRHAEAGRFEAVVVLAPLTLAAPNTLIQAVFTQLAEYDVRVFTNAGRELMLPDGVPHPSIAADAWPYLKRVK